MVPPLKDDETYLTGENRDTSDKRIGDIGSSKNNTTTAVDSKISSVVSQISFSHIQIYVDHVDDIDEYKRLEKSLNKYSATVEEYNNGTRLDIKKKRQLWQMIVDNATQETECNQEFVPQNRDVIKQLLVGFGMRITGCHQGNTTMSFLLTTKDSSGVQMVVTAKSENSAISKDATSFHHFDAENIERFYRNHNGRQGVAVLAFHVENLKSIRYRYQQLHPKLIYSYQKYEDCSHDSDGSTSVKVFEVYAYYKSHDNCDFDTSTEVSNEVREPDTGTLIRFIERGKVYEKPTFCILPGLKKVFAEFDTSSYPAYFDHWVSNVFSRTEFLTTLNDTLGFEPKVDFNAGVVAAGEAQIESTVTGNESSLETNDRAVTLRDQSQVYLPINNALSPVGHVHGFLKEIGQGIQHVANRVENLVEFVSRCNDYREITGEGFTFLNIPRSYYGVLSIKHLSEKSKISSDLAKAVMDVCFSQGITTQDGAVDLDLSQEQLIFILDRHLSEGTMKEEYGEMRDSITGAILSSRYVNLFSLLRNHISESAYLDIVKNKILCDVQGEDVLYQIFTCNILQKAPGDESPFFEFIQRVCSECESEDGCPAMVKAGCGGFGIRNFLTLFLSIEVNKALLEVCNAQACGDVKRQILAEKRVDCFTSQLNESNPILTQISDAMTREGNCVSHMKAAEAKGDTKAAEIWRKEKDLAGQIKTEGNQRLMECSHRYEQLMRALREEAI